MKNTIDRKKANITYPFRYRPPLEKLTDEERHQLIDKTYNDTHEFTVRNVISVQGLLKFNSEEEFYEWLKTEQKKYNGVSHHNFIKVESWYMNTFAHLIHAVNKFFGNAVGEIDSTTKIL